MLLFSTLVVSLAAQVAPVSAAAVDGSDKPADPMICERVQEVGSLIRAKKVCMLKSQWDAQRRDDRANLDRAQVQRGNIGAP